MSRGDLTWDLMQKRVHATYGLDATSYGFLLMHASWEAKPVHEMNVMSALSSVLPVESLQRVAARWAGRFRRQELLRSPNDEAAWYRYQKLGRLLHYVEATVSEGDPQSLLDSIEGFVGDAHQRWLKVAGGPKRDVIDESICSRPLAP